MTTVLLDSLLWPVVAYCLPCEPTPIYEVGERPGRRLPGLTPPVAFERSDESRLARMINAEWDRTIGTLQG